MNEAKFPRTGLSREALEFAPGLLAIQESPPEKLPRGVMYTVAALVAILLVWATFGRLDIIASAAGRLVPKTYVQIVQPADAGVVKQILVHEGERVTAGQVLIRLDQEEAMADKATLKTQLALRSLELRRIDAELTGHPLAKDSGDPPNLFREVAQQYRARHQSYVDALGRARDALQKARRDYAAGMAVLNKLKEVTPLLKREAVAYAGMGNDGYAPKLLVAKKERDYLEEAQNLAAQRQTVASLKASMDQAQTELGQVSAKYRANLLSERVDAYGKYSRLTEDLAKEDYKASLLMLRAPQSGIVMDLATHSLGTVVSPGTVLVTIVPDDEPLMADVRIKNDDVGFVHPKQSVRLKLAAYPFQKYGMLDGVVADVAPDATDTRSNGARGRWSTRLPDAAASYKAQVSLDSQVLKRHGKTLRLVPGMQVVAEIHEGRRSILEYLLSPVEKTLRDSGHER